MSMNDVSMSVCEWRIVGIIIVNTYIVCNFGFNNIHTIFILGISLTSSGSCVYLCTFYSNEMYNNEASSAAFH